VPTTARHAFPSPAGSDVPDVPVRIKNLADAIDLQTPWVSTTEPPKTNGLVWYNPTTGLTQITDGTTWFATTGANWVTYTPTFVMATSNGTKTGQYLRSGKLITVNASMTATSGVSLGAGAITVSLPTTTATRANNTLWWGSGIFASSGAFFKVMVGVGSASTAAQIFAVSTSNHGLGTPGNNGFTFVSGDFISVQLTYESAT
jgi:hypothetical protein